MTPQAQILAPAPHFVDPRLPYPPIGGCSAGENRLSLLCRRRATARASRHAIAVPEVMRRTVVGWPGLMEIAAGSGEPPQKWGQIHQMLGDKVSGLALTLPFAVDAQQLRVQHFASLTLDQVRP